MKKYDAKTTGMWTMSIQTGGHLSSLALLKSHQIHYFGLYLQYRHHHKQNHEEIYHFGALIICSTVIDFWKNALGNERECRSQCCTKLGKTLLIFRAKDPALECPKLTAFIPQPPGAGYQEKTGHSQQLFPQ